MWFGGNNIQNTTSAGYCQVSALLSSFDELNSCLRFPNVSIFLKERLWADYLI